MATYQQYSEVVAAYGYTLPPPAQPQANRIGLALLYAAIGVALGTMTGTGMAVVSMQPGGVAGWAHRLSLPNLSSVARIAPPVAHAPSVPVTAHATPAPAIQARVATPATPAAPVQAKIAVPAAPAPIAHPGIPARVAHPAVAEASIDTRVLHPVAVRHEAASAKLAPAPAVSVAHAAPATKPAAAPVKLAALRLPTALPVPAVVAVSLDEEVAPAVFYSEGDATVVDYDSTLDTILTSDGRTFVIGPTVAMSNAASWNDFRSNVHYRCDQGGKCTLTRAGVIALNAKLI